MGIISTLTALVAVAAKGFSNAAATLLGCGSEPAKKVAKLATGRIGPRFYPGAAKYNITRPGQATRRRK